MKYDTLSEDIFASVGTVLQTALATLDVPIQFEEAPLGDIGLESVEIRMDGPTIDEIANKQYHISVEVDMLVTLKVTGDLFRRHKILGACAEVLRNDIPLNQSGVFLGCLTTAKPFGGSEQIVTVNYGQIHKDRQLLHSAVSTTLHLLI